MKGRIEEWPKGRMDQWPLLSRRMRQARKKPQFAASVILACLCQPVRQLAEFAVLWLTVRALPSMASSFVYSFFKDSTGLKRSCSSIACCIK